jgi:hypothetical protein
MNKMQEHLLRAGSELGLRVIVPFEVCLDSGRKLLAEALLPDLGFPNGMIIGQSSTNFLSICDELKRRGYGYSVYGEPPQTEEFDLESYKEMFMEWGWSGEKAKRPDWIVKPSN